MQLELLLLEASSYDLGLRLELGAPHLHIVSLLRLANRVIKGPRGIVVRCMLTLGVRCYCCLGRHQLIEALVIGSRGIVHMFKS